MKADIWRFLGAMINPSKNRIPWREIVGLIPAGGHARRIDPLPCSKELFPVGFRPASKGGGLRPKVVSHYLLEKMHLAGITKVYIILRQGKWDIPSYFGDGSILNLSLAYLMMRLPFGAPYTIDQAYPFVQHALVAFGFPDILFQPDDAFGRLLDCQIATSSDIVLGIFMAHQHEMMDMVEVDEGGRVHAMVLKPTQTHLRYAWIFALWTPLFTSYLHEFLQKRREGDDNSNASNHEELSVGHVIQAAIREGVRAHAVRFSDHTYLDIGTPDDLVKAIQWGTKERS
ncbi:MAG: nucleotidyltransferase family protein [Nitrospiraceae bacterium]